VRFVSEYRYTRIRELLPSFERYNIIGVVCDFKDPRPSRGTGTLRLNPSPFEGCVCKSRVSCL